MFAETHQAGRRLGVKSALITGLLLLAGCSGSGTVQELCTADYAVFYRDRVEFGHGQFDRQSSAPHYYDLTRDGQLPVQGSLTQGSLASVGQSSPMLLSWQAGGSLFWADLMPSVNESDPPDSAQFLSVDRRGSAALPQADDVFRTAATISGGVWVRNTGSVEVSGWSGGAWQVQNTHPIASDIDAMNVGPTDRAPREVAFAFNDSIIATTGLEGVDIAQRQDVFRPPLQQHEQFDFIDITVSSDTSCNKQSFPDIINNRPNAPILEGVTYVTTVVSHAVGAPGSNTRLIVKEIRIFARLASSTIWREVIEINVPDVVTSSAVVASRNRGYLLVGTSTGLHGEPFQLNLDASIPGGISNLTLMGITPGAFANKLRLPPAPGSNRLPPPQAGSAYVVKVDAAMAERGPVEVLGANQSGLTLAPGMQ